MEKTGIGQKNSYIFLFTVSWTFLGIFLVFFMSIPRASRVFLITTSWFLSFCGCFLSVSESYSGRLNDCFLTVPECFCFYREGFWSTQRVFSCQPLDCFLGSWAFLVSFKSVSWVFIFFLQTVTRVFLVKTMFFSRIFLRVVSFCCEFLWCFVT